jgi:hypothetical protein
MGQRRNIDERDVDRLLAALSDRQIAELFGISETEVFDLRQSRRPKLHLFAEGKTHMKN